MRCRWVLLLLGWVVFVGDGSIAQAQSTGLPPETLLLDDLSAFRTPSANWSTADSVWADPERRHHLEAAPGRGVLVNQPTASAQEHLVTEWEHGDLELMVDVLMPRGSNSGLYLQGRYEVQLFDSWGVQVPTFGDMGGIYQRWRSERPEGERGIDGHPPHVNVARAPGLWQRLHIDFRAPRFNDEGEKVEPARFEKVTLNGVVIHRNIALRGPTRGAAFADEAPTGPLLIQGDHGPVAIKNVQYKRYEPGTIRLSDLHYTRYDAQLDEGLHQLDTVDVAARGTAEQLRHEVIGRDNDVAAVFEGTLTVPRAGRYAFDLGLNWIGGDPHFNGQVVGGGQLDIGGETVVVHPGSTRTATGMVMLEEGTHAVRLAYFKNRPWSSPRISLFVEGPELRRRALSYEAGPGDVQDPMRIEPDAAPVVLRSFVEHGGRKKTHTVSVGSPQQVHYAYDLAQGSLLQAWKGAFVQTNAMWAGRGIEQRAVPQGSGPSFDGAPPWAVLSTAGAAWPDSLQPHAAHEYLGYRLDADGAPIFRYRFKGLTVEDRLQADTTGGRLERTLHLSGRPTSESVYVRLIRADTLRAAGDGRFVAGDRAFYVTTPETMDAPLQVRRSRGARELLVPVSAADLPLELRYAIIW